AHRSAPLRAVLWRWLRLQQDRCHSDPKGHRAVPRGSFFHHRRSAAWARSSALLAGGRRFEQARLALVLWQPDSESRAAAHFAFHFNMASVGANDALDNHQAQARALLLGRLKRFENAIDLL